MPARCALQRCRPGPRRCRGDYPAGGRGRDPDAERLRRPARSGAGVRVKIGSGHCLRQTPGALSPPSRLARFTNSQFQRTAAPRCAAIMACDLSLCRARKWAQLCTQRQGRFRRINPTAAAPRWSQRDRLILLKNSCLIVCPFADSIAVLIGGFCDDGSKAGGASCVVL